MSVNQLELLLYQVKSENELGGGSTMMAWYLIYIFKQYRGNISAVKKHMFHRLNTGRSNFVRHKALDDSLAYLTENQKVLYQNTYY